jgi:hypothetical protein
MTSTRFRPPNSTGAQVVFEDGPYAFDRQEVARRAGQVVGWLDPLITYEAAVVSGPACADSGPTANRQRLAKHSRRDRLSAVAAIRAAMRSFEGR